MDVLHSIFLLLLAVNIIALFHFSMHKVRAFYINGVRDREKRAVTVEMIKQKRRDIVFL